MPIPARPQALLLATDLSARSDRAQARAIQLAKQWQARLEVVISHPADGKFSKANAYVDPAATDEVPPESPAAFIERMAQQALADAGVPLTIHVTTDAPGQAAARIAQETGCGLIITGTSRSDVAMRMDPGSTLHWLARHAKRPVLAVHDRVQQPYQTMTLASDFSTPAAQALQLANAWFDHTAQRTLLHGYDVPLPLLSLNDAPRDAALQQLHRDTLQLAKTHLAQALGADATHWNTYVQAGGPVRLLREHARRHATELTIITSHGRSALMDRLLGSVAGRLLETVGTDLLVIPAST